MIFHGECILMFRVDEGSKLLQNTKWVNLNVRHYLSRSPLLKKLVSMVGRSHAIYKGIMDLCCARLRDSESAYCGVKEAAYCSLRSQLLMALHDANIVELTSKVGLPKRQVEGSNPITVK